MPGEWREAVGGGLDVQTALGQGSAVVVRRHRQNSRGQRMRVLAELGGFWDTAQREGGGRFAGRRPSLAVQDVTDGMDVTGVT